MIFPKDAYKEQRNYYNTTMYNTLMYARKSSMIINHQSTGKCRTLRHTLPILWTHLTAQSAHVTFNATDPTKHGSGELISQPSISPYFSISSVSLWDGNISSSNSCV